MDTIKLVVFDLNKTLIKENSWYDLNLALGMTSEEDRRLMDLYESGKITYLEAQKELEKIYLSHGLATKTNIEKILFSYNYLPGARELVSYLKSKQYLIALVSGSMDLVVNKVCYDLSIGYGAANNHFVFDTNGKFIRLECVEDDTLFKLNQLKRYQAQFKLKPQEICCIGDGDNDRLIFEYTTRGITFIGSKITLSAWKTVPNLSQIESLL